MDSVKKIDIKKFDESKLEKKVRSTFETHKVRSVDVVSGDLGG